ncbi:MAG: anhydro-N-acetylmuramic acid kinase [Xanthomonadaceae bacterium]|nr:anhydro-N-acetylmuramic acid kinase [Xanthomonadaceae bacterium]
MSKPTPIKIAGAMTGTSCDGMDLVVISFSGNQMSTSHFSSVEYPSHLRKRVLDFQTPGSTQTAKKWCELDRDLGIWYGEVFKELLKTKKIDAISNHGQTLAHFPKSSPFGTTLQLGDPFIIAQMTGLTTITGHRHGDMAGGGQGAPLAPIFHKKLVDSLFKKTSSVAIHNLGGISNFSYFRRGECQMAFDTGPGNCLMDLATEIHTHGKMNFDRGGAFASQGKVDADAITKILRDPYIRLKPPKSTGRDDFHITFLKKITHTTGINLISTATALTIETIVDAYERFILKNQLPLDCILFIGGGAQNHFLITSIKKRLKNIKIVTAEEIGINAQAIEAQAFSYMGFLTLKGLALGGTWTGAKADSPPGLIVPGKNWNSLLRKLHTHT